MSMILAIFESLLAVLVVYGFQVEPLSRPGSSWVGSTATIGRAFLFALVCLLIFYSTDLYNRRISGSFRGFLRRLTLSSTLVVGSLVLIDLLLPGSWLGWKAYFMGLSTLVVLMLLVRLGYDFWGHRFVQRILILGTGPLAELLVTEMHVHPNLRYSIRGIVKDPTDSETVHFPYPVLGTMDRLRQIIDQARPQKLVVAVRDQRQLPLRTLLECRLRGILVEDGVELYERLTGKIAIEWLAPAGLVFSRGFRKSPVHLAAGRIMSIGAALTGLFLFCPLFLLIALLIKLESGGSVFFIQKRVGLDGKPFNLIKFRTMDEASQKASEWAEDNRDHITRVGRWLRRFRLDELPQFVNILRGEMNLVGPRPHPVSNFDLFVLVLRNIPECGEAIPYYSLRSWIRPGITGWAQIRYGYANGLEEEIEKARYDLYYIKHMSLGLDLTILFKTVKVMLFRGESRIGPHRLDLEAPEPAVHGMTDKNLANLS